MALFKGMTREGPPPYIKNGLVWSLPEVECEKCGAKVATGDWPWCKGNQQDHVRE